MSPTSGVVVRLTRWEWTPRPRPGPGAEAALSGDQWCRAAPSQRGEVRQRYREGQEGPLSALGLLLNAVVRWNARYLDAAERELREQVHHVPDELGMTRLTGRHRPVRRRRDLG